MSTSSSAPLHEPIDRTERRTLMLALVTDELATWCQSELSFRVPKAGSDDPPWAIESPPIGCAHSGYRET